jgi:hypothetical protein
MQVSAYADAIRVPSIIAPILVSINIGVGLVLDGIHVSFSVVTRVAITSK